jgi:hypothetical protein
MRFKLPSEGHALVLWQWIKYITYDFLALSKNGSNTNYLTIGGLSAAALYQSHADTMSILYDFLIYSKLYALMGTVPCPTLVQNYTSLDPATSKLFCGQVTDNTNF